LTIQFDSISGHRSNGKGHIIRVRTVHEKTDETQYPILWQQFRPTQGPIRFTGRTRPPRTDARIF